MSGKSIDPYSKLPPLDSFAPDVQAEIEADRARFVTCMEHGCAEAAGDVEGLHGPGSLAWEIYREPALLLGGIRAILLQLAHPAVAAGVDQNSTFREDVRGRAHRTFASTYALVFGDLSAARGAARRFHNIHNRVRGARRAGLDGQSGGSYKGNDPRLLLWVHATLLDTALLMFEQVVRPMSMEEKRRWFRGERAVAALLELPMEQSPATFDAFSDYYNGMLEGSELEVGRTARELAGVIFNVRGLTRLTRLDETLTAGLLPERVRTEYGLRWDAREQHGFARWMEAIKLVHRVIPPALRAVPAYHQAILRVALARGEAQPRLARAVNWLDRLVNLPLSLRPVGDD